MTFRPRRSALYMPGSNVRAMEKAKTLDCDVVIFDCEDAVAPEAKEGARSQVCAAAASGSYGSREVVIRINGLDTEWGDADIAAIAVAGADAILIPKVEHAAQIQSVAQHLQSAGSNAQIWAMIETPLAIVNIAEIARSATQLPLGCMVVGTNDLVKETRAMLDADRTAALYWLSAIVTAARAFGIDVLDGVYNNFSDLDGFERECQQGKMLGMDGKTIIHPSQIDRANTVFTPSGDDVAWARKIIEAFEQPENQAKGVITLEGKMVELLHAEAARRTVAIAQAVGL